MNNGKTVPRGGVYLQLAAGMILFGSATPVSKIVTSAMPVFIGSGLRVAIGALLLLPLALPHRAAIRRMSRRDWTLTACIAVFGMFGFSVLMLMGMALISGVTGSIVMATTPAITAAAAIVLMGEQATWRKLTAVALAVGGVLLLHLAGLSSTADAASDNENGIIGALRNLGHPTIVGSALVFGAVCCEAAYTLLGRRVSQNTPPLAVACLAAALSLPLFLPFAASEWDSFVIVNVDPQAWVAVLWYGAGTLAVGSWLWYSGIKRTEGSIAAAFMGLMPVSALVLSYVLLGEQFAWPHLAGFGLVFAGVLLMSWEHARTSAA